MFELKPLHKEAIQRALEKVERYRLLNEPMEAESICLDVLAIDPENQTALVMLILARTDQLRTTTSMSAGKAREAISRLKDEYSRMYYQGIVCERQAKAEIERGLPLSSSSAYEWLREAMGWYDKAEQVRPTGDDDAILRWNTCARLLNQDPRLRARDEDHTESQLE